MNTFPLIKCECGVDIVQNFRNEIFDLVQSKLRIGLGDKFLTKIY